MSEKNTENVSVICPLTFSVFFIVQNYLFISISGMYARI